MHPLKIAALTLPMSADPFSASWFGAATPRCKHPSMFLAKPMPLFTIRWNGLSSRVQPICQSKFALADRLRRDLRGVEVILILYNRSNDEANSDAIQQCSGDPDMCSRVPCTPLNKSVVQGPYTQPVAGFRASQRPYNTLMLCSRGRWAPSRSIALHCSMRCLDDDASAAAVGAVAVGVPRQRYVEVLPLLSRSTPSKGQQQ